jgi:lipid II:glycine glycyltransferase (peptidoglycan interpeptide bridge formation enzyme)
VTDAVDWPKRGQLELRHSPPADWDAHTVDIPGGHVYQSAAWAAHRRMTGWEPRYGVWPGGAAVLVLLRRWPLIGGFSGYIPRGPNPVDEPATAIKRLFLLRARLRDDGVDVLATDPEVPADSDYARRVRAMDFHQIEEIQPSRHRISLRLEGVDEGAAFEGIAKSTRQRIGKAEKDGIVIVRHDVRIAPDGVGEGFDGPGEATAAALDRFYDLLLETGERLQFSFGPRANFVAWWQAAHAAGHLVYLEARAATEEPLAGLLLYRHGDRLSTVHSGDHASARRDHPGALHLLRWRAIQLAIREGRAEMDMGGVDVAGARREPREGEPTWGLYQHKLSFGGHWLELAGAHESVIRPRRYAAGRLLGRVERVVRGVTGRVRA